MSLGVIEIIGTLFAYAYAETKSIARGGEMGALDIITIIALLVGKPTEYLMYECLSVCLCGLPRTAIKALCPC